jgi:drug/metabolite transporter (DMT)-like permease
MTLQKIIAIILIVVGGLGIVYGGFSYTSAVHNANIGSMHFSFSEKEHINIPMWAGMACILAGGVLLVIRRKI